MTNDEFLKIVKEEGYYHEWIHNNIKCCIRRCPDNLHWCGYVFLEEIHEFYGGDKSLFDIDVHGGVTYNDMTDDNLYKIGFDCNHYNDLAYILIKYPDSHTLRSPSSTYKTKQFVYDETNKMCDQLCKIKPKYIRDEKLKDILLN